MPRSSALRWPPNYVDRWLPVDAHYRNTVDNRSPTNLVEAVRQFNVDTCPRYQPLAGATWCNIFVWDVTSALHAEVPHWVDDACDTSPPGYGRELTANGTIDWFASHGKRNGWTYSTHDQAVHVANLGCPTVALWRNANAHGHVAIVIPSAKEMLIAQAGARCFSSGTLRDGFGSHTDEVEFWFHA